MKLKNKQILAAIMMLGDCFMLFIAFLLIFEEEMVFLGLLMMLFLAVDIYLTVDYIKALKHRDKVEKSLLADNERLRRAREQWDRMNRNGEQPSRARRAETEEELEELLSRKQNNREQSMRG